VKEKGFAIIFIIVGVLLILGVITGTYLLIKSNTHTQNPSLPKQILKPSLTPTPTPSAVVSNNDGVNLVVPKDWLVYKNTKVGFQVSYPPNYSKPITSHFAVANGQEDGDVVIGGDSEKGFLIDMVPAQTGYTLEDFFNTSLSMIGAEEKKAFNKESINVDGVDGIKVDIGGRTTQAIFRTKTYFITLNNHTPPTVSNENEKEFNTMINSLKFQVK